MAGGVAGMAAMSVLLLLFQVETRERIELFDAVARFVGVPGELALGFLAFVFAGVVAWPLIFLALEEYIPFGPDPATRGMVFAAALWIPFVLTGRGDIDGPLFVVFTAFSLLAHLAYGFTMGAVYGRLTGTGPSEADAPRYADAP